MSVKTDSLCCKSVKQTYTFQSYMTKEIFQVFHNLTCKSENLIYWLQCGICQLQYDGKNETSFNIHLIDHWKDAKSKASIVECKHFSEQNHYFQQHAEFALIEQIEKQTTAEETRTLLKQRQNFWVLKLKTLCPDRSNQE